MTESQSKAQFNESVLQLASYGLIGVGSNLAAYLLYLLATYYGLAPKTAMTVLYILGASFGFFGNRKWTFAHQGKLVRTVVKFTIAHILGYLLNLSILFTFVDNFGYAHQLVQAIAIIFVAVFLFMAFKYFVFARLSASSQGDE